MQEVEKILNEEKIEMDQIEVPVELEERLSNALKDKSVLKRRSNSWVTKAAAACFIIILVGYNFNTLAFYGKRLMGYDKVMNGTLKQLNELGKGQVIGKSYTFKNGVVLMLDGIMIDENQLLAFYSVKGPESSVIDSSTMSEYLSIKGMSRTYNMQSGQGEIDDKNNEVKWIASFEAPRFYEKTLNLEVDLTQDNILEKGNITFKLDRDKAMGYTLKKTLNKTLKADKTKVRFESITASPTLTVISGSIQNIFELAKDQISGERIRPNDIEVNLVANGKEIAGQGGGMSTNLNGIKFHKEFDALPQELQSLQIHLKSFSIDRDVNKQVDLNKDDENKRIQIEGQDLEINKIYESKGSAFITITTKESTILTRVYLDVDGKRTELEETIESNLIKQKDGIILNTRTLHFPKTGEDYKLIIERMTYTEAYNKMIDIPIN